MAKTTHEFRDPVHGFITCSSDERTVINSRPVQRLRHIHQLAMTYLLYPGATHRRFEHSLGVMELATRIYDVLTAGENTRHLSDEPRDIIDNAIGDNRSREHWRTVVRMGALCHDIGHLPFSHGAEVLLPPKVTHEKITWDLINSPQMAPLWKGLHVDPEEVAKVAVGPKEAAELGINCRFTTWESLMAEIVVGNAFGADRMDYLLRDSLHTGVAYGKFDVDRLIKTLRFMPKPMEGEEDQSDEPEIGVELGGLHAAESLLWARYFIFSQVYFHHIRKIYDIHLQEFMGAQFQEGLSLKNDLEDFLRLTDNEVLASLRLAAYDSGLSGHSAARRIEERRHFKKVLEITAADRIACPEVDTENIADILGKQIGPENVRFADKGKSAGSTQFPVLLDDGKIISSEGQSPAILNLPDVTTDFIFVAPAHYQQVKKEIRKDRITFLKSAAIGGRS